jgi:phosphatidylglycerophosphate synthase
MVLDPNEALQRFSLGILIAILISDVLDGVLARRWRVTSKFGYLLDGAADRASYASFLLGLYGVYGLSLVICTLIISRDMILYAARAFYVNWGTSIEQSRWNTKLYAAVFKLLVTGALGVFYLQLFNLVDLVGEDLTHASRVLNVAFACFALLAYLSLWKLIRAYAASLEGELY